MAHHRKYPLFPWALLLMHTITLGVDDKGQVINMVIFMSLNHGTKSKLEVLSM